MAAEFRSSSIRTQYPNSPRSSYNNHAYASSNSEFPLAERLGHFVSAYDIITLTSTLVLSFAVLLAALYSSEELFHTSDIFGHVRMYCFHIAISSCIGCSLHCIVILSLINYQINRNIGHAKSNLAADYLENTYKYRQQARSSFGGSLILFVSSLCVLFWNGLPSVLAIINTMIVGIFIIIIATSVHQMGQKKIVSKNNVYLFKEINANNQINHYELKSMPPVSRVLSESLNDSPYVQPIDNITNGNDGNGYNVTVNRQRTQSQLPLRTQYQPLQTSPGPGNYNTQHRSTFPSRNVAKPMVRDLSYNWFADEPNSTQPTSGYRRSELQSNGMQSDMIYGGGGSPRGSNLRNDPKDGNNMVDTQMSLTSLTEETANYSPKIQPLNYPKEEAKEPQKDDHDEIKNTIKEEVDPKSYAKELTMQSNNVERDIPNHHFMYRGGKGSNTNTETGAKVYNDTNQSTAVTRDIPSQHSMNSASIRTNGTNYNANMRAHMDDYSSTEL